jgi:hypothetical protein
LHLQPSPSLNAYTGLGAQTARHAAAREGCVALQCAHVLSSKPATSTMPMSTKKLGQSHVLC